MTKKLPIFVYLSFVVLAALYFVAPFDAHGQLSNFGLPEQSQPAEIVTAHGVLSIDKVQPGSTFQIAVIMKFAETWHANANPAGAANLIPTEIIVSNTPDVTFGEIVYPKGDLLTIASLSKDPVPVYHDEVVIGVQATLSQNAKIGQTTLPLQLRYQACTDDKCLFPKTIDVDVPIEIVGTDQSVRRINDGIFASLQFGDSSGSTPVSGGGKFAQALSKGYFWAFLFVFLGGIATSLTPCVYPLIPITVSVFGANESAGRFRSFLLSVTYVFGIAVMYSILGIAVASTGAVFGQIMANPFVIGFVTLFLVALGLSMLGVFELQLPVAMQNKLNTVGGAGFPGAFAMGTVAGIIAAPCTGPALAAVLTYVATTGSLFLGFWLMLTYALGMGLLFIAIGTFSGVLSSLPRSGGWMYVLENVFGVAIIAVALYFLKDIVEPLRAFLRNSVEFFAIAGVLLVVGILLGKFTQRFKDLPRPVQLQKAFGVILAVLGLYMLIGGFTTAESHLDWVSDEAEGLALAKKEKKLVMLDFYATWCAACNELDHKTYSDPKVAARLSKYVNVKLDFTKTSDEVKRLTEKYKIPGLPVVIFLDSDGKQLSRFDKFVTPTEFLKILDEVEKGRKG
jgi:thioredoxin:protein disulfide reductase